MTENQNEDTSKFPALGRALLFLDKKENIERVVRGLYILCALLVVADFFYYKKVYFAVERFPGFYALYGFFMCAALVICAKGMRLFLMRSEEYYAPMDVEAEDYPEDGLDRERVDD
ncbi:MAG: hypothetical protein AAF468_19725 [Pseudomonadota bacterium]